MPWIERKKVIKKGWLFDKKGTYFEEVKLLGETSGEYEDRTIWKEYLVENKKNEIFTVSRIFN